MSEIQWIPYDPEVGIHPTDEYGIITYRNKIDGRLWVGYGGSDYHCLECFPEEWEILAWANMPKPYNPDEHKE